MGTIFNALIGALIDWLVDGAVESWKQCCKYALQAGAVTGGQWSTAGDVVGKLAGIMLYVAVACGAVAIVRKSIARKWGEALMVFFQTGLSWALTLVTLWLVVQVSNMAQQLTGRILGVDISKPDQGLGLPELKAATIKGAFAGPLLLVMALIVVLAGISIMCCMAARSFLLVVAVCFVTMAWMVVTGDTMRQAANYLGWVVGIILYQPICALLIYLTGGLMKASGDDSPMTLVVAVVGMFLSSVAPWVVIRKIVSIIPGVGKGLSDTAQSGQETTGAVKDTVEKTVSAGMQFAMLGAMGGKAPALGSQAGGAVGKGPAAGSGVRPGAARSVPERRLGRPTQGGAGGRNGQGERSRPADNPADPALQASSAGHSDTRNGAQDGSPAARAIAPTQPQPSGGQPSVHVNAPGQSPTRPVPSSEPASSEGGTQGPVEVHVDSAPAPSPQGGGTGPVEVHVSGGGNE